MFCCYADHVRAPETGYLTAKFAADHCYSREEPKPKNLDQLITQSFFRWSHPSCTLAFWCNLRKGYD
ncbi:hypothetical protein H4Q26_006439 [Puccinia striiformis f. sp. tritici PST-130]|nr:hypothetical protein H4Q26_006439 [Puccinia striiformis f. sp. tritici PST-130]